jgi:hypothetical protein
VKVEWRIRKTTKPYRTPPLLQQGSLKAALECQYYWHLQTDIQFAIECLPAYEFMALLPLPLALQIRVVLKPHHCLLNASRFCLNHDTSLPISLDPPSRHTKSSISSRTSTRCERSSLLDCLCNHKHLHQRQPFSLYRDSLLVERVLRLLFLQDLGARSLRQLSCIMLFVLQHCITSSRQSGYILLQRASPQ